MGLGLRPNTALENPGLVQQGWGNFREMKCVRQPHLCYLHHFTAEETGLSVALEGPGHCLKPRSSGAGPTLWIPDKGQLQPSPHRCKSRQWASRSHTPQRSRSTSQPSVLSLKGLILRCCWQNSECRGPLPYGAYASVSSPTKETSVTALLL